MKEWNELYRDFLSAYNVMGEAIATAKTLHERDSRELAAALARAEAAEAKTIETLENILLALGVDPNGIDEIYMEQTAKGVINAILERIADLEAQLAALKAGEWRPVSERPDSSACLYEVTVRASWDGDVFMTHGNLYMPHDGPDILRWRPAPPQE